MHTDRTNVAKFTRVSITIITWLCEQLVDVTYSYKWLVYLYVSDLFGGCSEQPQPFSHPPFGSFICLDVSMLVPCQQTSTSVAVQPGDTALSGRAGSSFARPWPSCVRVTSNDHQC